MSERDEVIRSLQDLRSKSRLTPGMKETVGSVISHLESYPAGKHQGAPGTDNLAFWFDGNDTRGSWYEKDRGPTLPERIDAVKNDFNSKIHDIEHDIRKHRKKNIKGRDYWYFWKDGAHHSKGPVEGRPDPRDPLRKQVEDLRKEMVEKERRMLSCTVKVLGDHLVIDVELFKKHVDKKLPAEAVMIKEMVS